MAVCLVWLRSVSVYILIFGVFCYVCHADYQFTGNLKLNDNLQLGWRINSTKGTIQFTVKAKIVENGWFMIGFAPQNNFSRKVSFEDISGDGFVVWRGESEKLGSIWRITEVNVEKGNLLKEEHQDVHLGSSAYNKKALTLKAIVWRPLKTKNDMEIKKGEIVVFGSNGNDHDSKIRKWKNKMKELNKANAIQDAFTAVQHVHLFKKTSNQKQTKSNDKKGLAYAAAIAEKHWIGVILGISAFLTVLITCSVYCCSKKKKKEFKRVVSMPFHKNSDFDDEAKVAFLQSEET